MLSKRIRAKGQQTKPISDILYLIYGMMFRAVNLSASSFCSLA